MDLVKATSFGSRLFIKIKFLEETKYFRLKKGTCQDDPISAFLFFLELEILYMLLKATFHMKNLDIFYHCYLLNADDKTFL